MAAPRMIECTLSLGDTICHMTCPEGSEPIYRQSKDAELSAKEFRAVRAILETICCLSLNQEIDQHFNPGVTHNPEDEKIMKLRWNRSGKLTVLEDDATSRWCHASTVEEAIGKRRSFTCSRKVFHALPRRRDKKVS